MWYDFCMRSFDRLRTSERLYWLGFSSFAGVGPTTFRKLLSYFGSAEDAWNASENELKKGGMKGNLNIKFVQFKNRFIVQNYAEKLKKADVKFVILTDKEYPKLLKQIPNPPFLLYVRGDLGVLGGLGLFGVVGTRKITEYGRTVTEMFGGELSRSGFTIVSGLALGVDAVSHAAAVQNGGSTIAVLGCGVDCCTPSSNQSLYNSIVNGSGCVISEFPLSQIPTKGSFPSRNRIIAGLSQALLVTEGAQDSGSLITADYAFKFGRPVFAVPGPITSSLSKGPFQLVQKGATMVTSPEEVLKILGKVSKGETKVSKVSKGETKEEQKILILLENEVVHFDDIVRITKIKSSKLGPLLSLMEVKGMVKSQDGGMFSLSQSS